MANYELDLSAMEYYIDILTGETQPHSHGNIFHDRIASVDDKTVHTGGTRFSFPSSLMHARDGEKSVYEFDKRRLIKKKTTCME